MPELSIIVPVYKTEKYLPKCIDSILAQTFTDFELILIDDGSPDRCGEICDEYAAKDDRIIVIHQKNQGVSAARNAGLDIARGEYIGFVDSDDQIEEEFGLIMLQQAHEKHAEIVSCSMRVCDAECNPKRDILTEEFIYDSQHMTSELFNTPDKLGGSCCNKIFLHSAITGIRFPIRQVMCEDRAFLFRCYIRCKKIYKLPIPLYDVRENPNSTTRTDSFEVPLLIIEGSRSILNMVRKEAPEYEEMATKRYVDDCIRYLSSIKSTNINNDLQRISMLRKAKRTCLNCLIKSWFRRIMPTKKVYGYLLGLKNISVYGMR